MGATENLRNQEAITKIREMATAANIGMFCTGLDRQPFGSCPLATQEVDDEGNVWFLSARDSDHNQDVAKDPATQLIYSNFGDMEFLSLYGKTIIVEDQERVERYWSPMVEAWFKEGPTDPNVSLLCFKPEEGYYWDTQNGKMISFLKTMITAYTPAEMEDDGVSGKLTV